MARDWLGRKERSDRASDVDPVAEDLANRPDTDPISDEAESERDEQPTEVRVDAQQAEPEQVTVTESPESEATDGQPEVATLADRLGAVTRRALAGLGAAVIARLPGVQAAMLPRLPRLVLA
ncbi:MAG TPA: hypothetical protein VN255_10090, partial [Mycobacterium sp.]|nr:hypothetical protein [Mycobacterium sp.]